ncbi:hypothetical protein V2G26_000775 [Clonostachys chloroleuca]
MLDKENMSWWKTCLQDLSPPRLSRLPIPLLSFTSSSSSSSTTANGVRSSFSTFASTAARGTQRARNGIYQQRDTQDRPDWPPGPPFFRSNAGVVPTRVQSVDSPRLQTHLRLRSYFILQLVIYAQRVY